MKRIYITEIQDGMINGSDVLDEKGNIIIEKGKKINLPDLALLMDNGIDHIMLDDGFGGENPFDDAPHIKRLKTMFSLRTDDEVKKLIEINHKKRFEKVIHNDIMKEFREKSLEYIYEFKYKLA